MVLERIAAQCMGSGVLLVKHRIENGHESENGFRNKDSILIWVSTYGIIHMAVEQDRGLLHLTTPYPMQIRFQGHNEARLCSSFSRKIKTIPSTNSQEEIIYTNAQI